MKSIKEYEFWFVTGSQHLYGPETLEQVAKDSQAMVDGLNASGKMPCKIVYKPTVKTPATRRWRAVIPWMRLACA